MSDTANTDSELSQSLRWAFSPCSNLRLVRLNSSKLKGLETC
jgi:hypothetical protein